MDRYNDDNNIPYQCRLPRGWTDYTAYSQYRVLGTRFVPCRVPLKSEYFDTWYRNVPPFTPEMLMDTIMNIGLVIDFTDTERYYDGRVFERRGIEYAKIRIKGRQAPQDREYQLFCGVVDEFLDSDENRGKNIIVHCTHGVNRTGFMICRYMIENMDMTTDEAVARFSTSRGHTMERYIDELRAIEMSL